MASVTESIEVAAPAERVWEVIADPGRFESWVASHEGFVGEAPAALTVGNEFGQRLRVLGMPAEISWTVEESAAPQKLHLAGSGPMGVAISSTYLLEPVPAGTAVTVTFDFSGAAVLMVGSQLTRETGASLATSLQRLKQLAEA
jgi:uncharacterized protein YndB with AHSA1/START domain